MSTSGQTPGRALRILSVDDSRAVHAFLDRIFMDSLHVLTHAMDGPEGLKYLSESQSPGQSSPFDVVLLDFEMPLMTGAEVLDEIALRALPVPVIMMTSKNDPSLISAMLEKGAKEYIMKPFTPDILFEKIGFVLGIEGAQVGESL